jgi:SecD/SecF fusion protein
VATDEHFRAVSSDPLTARNKLTEWLQKPENANATISDYNALPPEQGGPPAGILWFPDKVKAGLETPPLAQRPIQPHAVQEERWQFSGADLANVYPTSDNAGLPAVGFQMTGERRADFTAFTTAFLRKQMAIVLNDEYVTAPVIRAPLPGGGIIEGGFTATEVVEMVTVLRSGSLKIKPILEAEEKVGASIGDDYVRRNVNAALLTFAVIALFMCFYYRWLGVWATVALVCNLMMLLGAMVLTQSTLTLAGIGGIVLTMGMAVDANILIFERMREEQEKGRKPLQAAKEGFQHALSAIVDGNLTTLITGVILYIVGTGTIKGFAVTLCIGILTTMFAALVITRVLIHFQLQRGVDRWRMVRWMADANFKFMRKAPVAIGISAVVIVVGVGGFILQKDTDKLGIDFLGGASVKVRTEHPEQVAHMRTLVAALPGEIASAEVVDLPSSRDSSGAAREFRVTFKTDPERSTGVERDFGSEVARGLADVLQKDRAALSVTTEAEATRVAGTLYFEKKHSVEDVKSVLASAGLTEPAVEFRGDERDVFQIQAGVAAGSTAEKLLATIENAFTTAKTDSGGRAYKLSGPIGDSNVIGAQVVGELRDSAIMALFWSCLAILLYIRVRFAEYSYGFAALAADLHDVLTTVAAIALCVAVPALIKLEMNLTMIAAFLTILGYSLNDTIVTFDRIRENRPRVKGTLHEIVDLSINQTLARTIVTGGTVLVSDLIILAFNFGTGNVLEGFAFALAFGCLTGTYSSIFIAGPLFVWLELRAERKAKASGNGPSAGSKSVPAQPVKGSAG